MKKELKRLYKLRTQMEEICNQCIDEVNTGRYNQISSLELEDLRAAREEAFDMLDRINEQIKSLEGN